MAKKAVAPAVATGVEVVEDLHAITPEEGVEFVDVTGKDDLPAGVEDTTDDEPEKKPAAVKDAKTGRFQKADAPDEDELPEDLKGKTPAQLAKMYKDAQTLIGRQGTELGDLRRSADIYIKQHLTRPAAPAAPAKPAEPVKPLDDVDFFTNPKAAIERMITEHPLIKRAQGSAQTLAQREMIRTRMESAREFNTAHPDCAEVLADPEFRDWVGKSKIRQHLLLRAHQHYDLDAANDVFNTWKELKSLRKPAPAEDASKKKPAGKPAADAAAARVPTGGNAAPKASGASEKIYRRADLIRLQQEDPARYELMGDEITKAYVDGRVR